MSKLASFVAGFGGGYIRAQDKEYERARQAKMDARQDKLDAQQAEQFGWARDAAAATQRERDNRDALDKAVTEGMDAGKVKDAAAVSYTGTDGAQKTAYQPDLQTAQFAADQQRLEEGQSLTPPATPSAPKVEQAASVRTLDGARRLFSGLTAASDAKKFADDNPVTPYAKYMALSERLAGMAGGQEKADAYLKRAKDAEKEGAFRALTMLDAGDPDGALKAWNSTGAKRLDAGQKFVTATDKAGNKTHQVVNSDGSVAVPNVEQAMLRYLSGIDGVVKQADARASSAAKLREKLFEPFTLKEGEKRMAINPETREAVPLGENPRVGGGRGTGAGAGAGEKPKDPLEAGTKAWEFLLNNSADKGALTSDQVGRGHAYTRQLLSNAAASGRGLDPSVAALLARNAVTDPSSVNLAFDRKTGALENVVEYQGNKFAIESFGTSQQSRMKPEQVAPALAGFLGELPAEVRNQLIPAAHDQAARNSLQDALRAEVSSPEWAASFKQANRRDPKPADINATVENRTRVLDAQLNLISRYGFYADDGTKKIISQALKQAGYAVDDKGAVRKKAEAPSSQADASRLDAGGLSPDRYKGLSGRDMIKAQDADLRAQAAANRPNVERLQATRTAAAQDPDLRRLEDERSQLIRAGKAVEANAKIEQIKKLRQERYGL